jgi:DNA-binding CsgD family transcriptional regulator
VDDVYGNEIPESVLNWQENLKRNKAAAIQQVASTTEPPESADVVLSAREQMVAKLFADDHSTSDIGRVLGLTTETVRSYLRRVREKYASAGRDATNQLQLRARLIEDDLLSDE